MAVSGVFHFCVPLPSAPVSGPLSTDRSSQPVTVTDRNQKDTVGESSVATILLRPVTQNSLLVETQDVRPAVRAHGVSRITSGGTATVIVGPHGSTVCRVLRFMWRAIALCHRILCRLVDFALKVSGLEVAQDAQQRATSKNPHNPVLMDLGKEKELLRIVLTLFRSPMYAPDLSRFPAAASCGRRGRSEWRSLDNLDAALQPRGHPDVSFPIDNDRFDIWQAFCKGHPSFRTHHKNACIQPIRHNPFLGYHGHALTPSGGLQGLRIQDVVVANAVAFEDLFIIARG